MRRKGAPRIAGNYRKRLVCIVEGRGEAQAVPRLCARILDDLRAWDWFVDPDPVRLPRSQLVDESSPSPRRPARTGSMSRALELALARPADAIVVLCDSDDDCPAEWGTSATKIIRERTRGGAVMVVREFEAWLLISRARSDRVEGRRVDEIRDAKGRLSKLTGGYLPTVHQSKLTGLLDLEIVRAYSDSFDKLVRTLAEISGVECPERPRAERRG